MVTIMTPTNNVILYVIQCITAIGGNSTGKGRRDDRLLIDFPYLSGCKDCTHARMTRRPLVMNHVSAMCF